MAFTGIEYTKIAPLSILNFLLKDAKNHAAHIISLPTVAQATNAHMRMETLIDIILV